MKQLLIVLLAALVSCNSQQTEDQHQNHSAKDEDRTAIVLSNNGAKWKADDATKKNVAAMMQVLGESRYADASNRMQLHTNLKTTIDTLIKECRMKGPEHDALHVWLENVLDELKDLKEGDEEYDENYATLKKAVSNFYQSFE